MWTPCRPFRRVRFLRLAYSLRSVCSGPGRGAVDHWSWWRYLQPPCSWNDRVSSSEDPCVIRHTPLSRGGVWESAWRGPRDDHDEGSRCDFGSSHRLTGAGWVVTYTCRLVWWVRARTGLPAGIDCGSASTIPLSRFLSRRESYFIFGLLRLTPARTRATDRGYGPRLRRLRTRGY